MIEAMSLNGIYSLSYLCLEFSNILSMIIEFLSRRFFYTHTAFPLHLVASTCFAVLTMSITYFSWIIFNPDWLDIRLLFMDVRQGWDVEILTKRIVPKFVMRVGSCGIKRIYGIWREIKKNSLIFMDFCLLF